MNLAAVKNAFSRWLYLEDDEFIDVGLALVVAHGFGGDPVWLFLIAASGSAKTEFLRALGTGRIHHLSALTPNTFVSGLNQPGRKDPSLLPHLNGKVVVIKDFTTILNENQKLRSKIFGQLRDIYDGSTAKAFGSGVGTRSYNCHMGLIAGVTPAVERYQTIDQILGERFLNYRLNYENRDKAVERAMQNAACQTEMRSELLSAVSKFLRRDWPHSSDGVSIPRAYHEQIRDLASLIGLLRTQVPKNRAGVIEYVPQVEIGTRLAVQLTKLGAALTITREKPEFGQDEYAVLLKVARDSVPSLRMRLLPKLLAASTADRSFAETSCIAELAAMPLASTRTALEDLFLLDMLDRKGSNPVRWRVQETLVDRLTKTEFLMGLNKLPLSVVQLPGGARENR